MRHSERFTLQVVNRSEYRFKLQHGQEEISIRRAMQSGLLSTLDYNICSARRSLLLQGKIGAWPIDIRLEENGTIVSISSSLERAGSTALCWLVGSKRLTILREKPDCIVGKFHAFRIIDGRCLCYWQKPFRSFDIEGVFKRGEDKCLVAAMVFSVMHDWDTGYAWK